MLPDPKHIVALADVYLSHVSIRETVLSNRLFGESKKLALMRAGGDITVTRYRQVLVWFSEHWPEGADWPGAMVRPESVAR